MNTFDPLRTKWSLFSSANVAVPPASEPACASVKPNPPNTCPVARSGTYFCFWASVPKLTIGDVPSVVWADTVIAWLTSTFASSSMMIR